MASATRSPCSVATATAAATALPTTDAFTARDDDEPLRDPPTCHHQLTGVWSGVFPLRESRLSPEAYGPGRAAVSPRRQQSPVDRALRHPRAAPRPYRPLRPRLQPAPGRARASGDGERLHVGAHAPFVCADATVGARSGLASVPASMPASSRAPSGTGASSAPAQRSSTGEPTGARSPERGVVPRVISDIRRLPGLSHAAWPPTPRASGACSARACRP